MARSRGEGWGRWATAGSSPLKESGSRRASASPVCRFSAMLPEPEAPLSRPRQRCWNSFREECSAETRGRDPGCSLAPSPLPGQSTLRTEGDTPPHAPPVRPPLRRGPVGLRGVARGAGRPQARVQAQERHRKGGAGAGECGALAEDIGEGTEGVA